MQKARSARPENCPPNLLELPGLTHLLHGQNPTLVAKGLAGFFTCRPIPESF